MKKLCIIPCGRKKIWDHHPEFGPSKAKETYIGVFHRLCQSYAKAFFDDWAILSAKHGFLLPDDIVPENYDVSFSMNKQEIIKMEDLCQQSVNKKLDIYNHIIVLGGKKYQPIIQEVFKHAELIEFPLKGTRGIGEMQQRLKRSMEYQQPIHTTDENSRKTRPAVICQEQNN